MTNPQMIPGYAQMPSSVAGQTGGSNDPSQPYYVPGKGWIEGGKEAWARDHRINEQTGDLEGPSGLVPDDYARSYQAQSDRAIWRRREALMGDAVNY